MNRTVKHILITCLVIAGLQGISRAVMAEGVLIGHKDTPVDALSHKQIKRIFLGKTTRWDNGESIVPCIHETDSDASRFFFNNIINKSVARFGRYWNKQLFSGNGVPPKMFETGEEIVDFVKANKGALCFVDNTDNINMTGVRIVQVDG